MTAPGDIPDLLDVEVPVGGRVMVVADLHLAVDPRPADLAATEELAAAIAAVSGPGVVVFAGNLFDAGADIPAALAAHPRLRDAVAAFAGGEGRRVVVLPGSRDAQLAWSESARKAVTDQLLATVALTADLLVSTGSGVRKVRVDPGQSFDPLSAPTDARNPLDTPFATHVRRQVLPQVRRRAALRADGTPLRRHRADGGGEPAKDRWLSGIEQLDDEGSVARFIVSRLVYRRLVHSAWLLLVPLVVALVLRLPATALSSAKHGALTTRMGLFVAATVVELLLLILVSVLAIRVTTRAMGAVSLADPGSDPNEEARARGRELVTAGYCGLITGHSCRAEMTHLGGGFYANAGAGAQVVSEYPSRLPGLGLPPVFMAHRTLSWAEIDAGSELRVQLRHSRHDVPGAALSERLMANRPLIASTLPAGQSRPAAPGRPGAGGARGEAAHVVAAFPHGENWPRPASSERHDRRVRRLVSALLVVVGFASLFASMSDPLSDRLNVLRDLFPTAVPEAAAGVSAFFGVAIVVVARSIRRGQRRAWFVTQALLVATAIVHLVKGLDFVATIVALVVSGLLYLFRSSFQARTDVAGVRRGLTNVLGATALTIVAGVVTIEANVAFDRTTRGHDHYRSVSWPHALEATLYRMIGDQHTYIPPHFDRFLSPALGTATAFLVLALAWVLFRPVLARHRHGTEAPTFAGRRVLGVHAHHPPAAATTGSGAHPAGPGGASRRDGSDAAGVALGGAAGLARARTVFERHGSGTLDYFALRPDKDFFFWGDTVVAHAVYGGTCLVSPDPIGPASEREEAWKAFRRYADRQGWVLGGLGIGEDWLPVYRASGMNGLYVGDEAVVRVDRFGLEGGRFKGLRQAVNRVAKYGYTISFHDPSDLDPKLRAELKTVMTMSRRGDVERGFSMTLGRVFEPDDKGLLLVVVHAPPAEGEAGPGRPVTFCQYVPAPGIGGYSLDLMRRDDGQHPNGLIDFAVVETIKELKARGMHGLGLNFATMRAVLAGEAGEGLVQRGQAWLLKRMGDSMQIESLWKFNAKFDPDWQARYAIYDAPENMLAVGLAVARAESFWELPVIGRFLVPPAGPGSEPAPTAPAPVGSPPAAPADSPPAAPADSPPAAPADSPSTPRR